MEITIRKGTADDTDAFIHLLEDVRQGMDHPEWFYLDPPEWIREQMHNGTMQLWVAMDEDRLAGALSILIPGDAAFNYGYDLGFSHEERMQVVNMDSAAVSSEYRGRGIQQRLLDEAENEIRRAGERILLCTVHPDNSYSLQNVLKQGYTIQKQLEKYGSVRYLLRKNIF